MKIYRILGLAVTVLLSACQTTTLREYSDDEPNQARQQLEQEKLPEYQSPKESQMRMYVFTDFEQKNTVAKPRTGYYVDFEVKNNAAGN